MESSALIKQEDGVESAKICRRCMSTGDALEALMRDESGQFTGLQIKFEPGIPSHLCTMCGSRLKNHLDHSAEQTVGTELSIKTEVTPPDTAKDLHLNQKRCPVHQANSTYESSDNQPKASARRSVKAKCNAKPFTLMSKSLYVRGDVKPTVNTVCKRFVYEQRIIKKIDITKHKNLPNQKQIRKRNQKLNPEQSLKLIELVKQYPELWCKSNEHYRKYKNTKMQESAWVRLSLELGISAIDAKNNWRALLANFRVYRARVKTSQETGSGHDEIYRPRWFAYESMLFLTESSDVVQTTDTIGLARPTSHGPSHQPTQSTVTLEVPCSSQNCFPVSPSTSHFSVDNIPDNSNSTSTVDTPRVASTTRQRRQRAHDDNENERTALLQALVDTMNRHMQRASSGIAIHIANWIDNFDSRHRNLAIGKLYQAMHSIETEINQRNETTT